MAADSGVTAETPQDLSSTLAAKGCPQTIVVEATDYTTFYWQSMYFALFNHLMVLGLCLQDHHQDHQCYPQDANFQTTSPSATAAKVEDMLDFLSKTLDSQAREQSQERITISLDAALAATEATNHEVLHADYDFDWSTIATDDLAQQANLFCRLWAAATSVLYACSRASHLSANWLAMTYLGVVFMTVRRYSAGCRLCSEYLYAITLLMASTLTSCMRAAASVADAVHAISLKMFVTIIWVCTIPVLTATSLVRGTPAFSAQALSVCGHLFFGVGVVGRWLYLQFQRSSQSLLGRSTLLSAACLAIFGTLGFQFCFDTLRRQLYAVSQNIHCFLVLGIMAYATAQFCHGLLRSRRTRAYQHFWQRW